MATTGNVIGFNQNKKLSGFGQETILESRTSASERQLDGPRLIISQEGRNEGRPKGRPYSSPAVNPAVVARWMPHVIPQADDGLGPWS